MNLPILHRWRQEGMPWPLCGVKSVLSRYPLREFGGLR